MSLALLPWLFLPLLLDLLVAATRASLLNLRLARLGAVEEPDEAQLDDVTRLVNERVHLRASLKLAQVLLRLLTAGIVFVAFMPLSLLLALAIMLITAILLWLLEFTVERVVLREVERWALRLSPIASLVMGILTPLTIIPLRLTQNLETADRLVTLTEDEFKSLLDTSESEGMLEQEEHKMISSILRLSETLAREIMVPRIDMLALDVGTPFDEAVAQLIESGFSRVPVYRDNIDNVIGMLYTKDMLQVQQDGNGEEPLPKLLREANFIPETKPVDELLAEMQAQHIHIAIVVDEYGGVAGLVTLEDIVEEIVGEIQDEYDDGEELLFKEIKPGEYTFHGRIDLDDFNDIMNSDLDTGEADTLGGLIYSRLGRVPNPGESLQEDEVLLIVEEISGRRIHKVNAKRHISPDKDNNHAE